MDSATSQADITRNQLNHDGLHPEFQTNQISTPECTDNDNLKTCNAPRSCGVVGSDADREFPILSFRVNLFPLLLFPNIQVVCSPARSQPSSPFQSPPTCWTITTTTRRLSCEPPCIIRTTPARKAWEFASSAREGQGSTQPVKPFAGVISSRHERVWESPMLLVLVTPSFHRQHRRFCCQAQTPLPVDLTPRLRHLHLSWQCIQPEATDNPRLAQVRTGDYNLIGGETTAFPFEAQWPRSQTPSQLNSEAATTRQRALTRDISPKHSSQNALIMLHQHIRDFAHVLFSLHCVGPTSYDHPMLSRTW